MAERLTKIKINGREVVSGQQLTLERSPGRRRGRYRFDWAEESPHGLILSVFGPVKARGGAINPHYRLANVSAVVTVHKINE